LIVQFLTVVADSDLGGHRLLVLSPPSKAEVSPLFKKRACKSPYSSWAVVKENKILSVDLDLELEIRL